MLSCAKELLGPSPAPPPWWHFPAHLQELLDAAQVVLVEDVGLLQKAAVLLVDLPQQVVEHQRGVRLLAGSVRPVQGRESPECLARGKAGGLCSHPPSPVELTESLNHLGRKRSLRLNPACD